MKTQIQWKTGSPALVILGGWNPHILLKKEWMKRYIFPKHTVQIQIPVGPVVGPPTVVADRHRISLLGNQLRIIPEALDDAVLESTETIATNLANFLPHTPVSAMGINFGCERVEPLQSSDWFSERVLDKTEQLGEIKAKAQSISLVLKNKRELNISLQFKEENPTICELNFHHEIESISEIKEIFANQNIIEYRKEASNIVENILDLETVE